MLKRNEKKKGKQKKKKDKEKNYKIFTKFKKKKTHNSIKNS